jgi:hypothetical protein
MIAQLREAKLLLGDIIAGRCFHVFLATASPALFNQMMVALESPLRLPEAAIVSHTFPPMVEEGVITEDNALQTKTKT